MSLLGDNSIGQGGALQALSRNDLREIPGIVCDQEAVEGLPSWRSG